MGFLKKYPIFCILLVLFLLVLGAGIYLTLNERAKAVAAEEAYEAEVRRLADVSTGVVYETVEGNQRIKPTAENRELLEQRLQQVRSDLERIRKGMAARTGVLLGDSADEFTFLPKLQSYIAALKALAAVNEVKLESEEAFGFAKYATQAEQPQKEMIPELNLQRQILDYLLRQLIESKPTAILAVEREFIEQPPNEDDPRSRRRNTSTEDDVFAIQELVTARANEFIDTSAFRIVFTGRTDVLREFLNRLGRFELPVIVRSVEVQPADPEDELVEEDSAGQDTDDSLLALFGEDEESGEEAQPEDVPGRDPVITENQSKFTVVIEYVEVRIESEESNEEGES